MSLLLRGAMFVLGFLAGLFTIEPGTVPPPNTSPADGLNTGDQSGEQPTAPSGDDRKPRERRFTQAEVDDVVKARLAEEQNRAKTRETAAQRKTAEEALAKNQEWQTLAEQRGTELEQTKTRAETADRYAERLNTWVESEIKDWPKEVTALDPGKDRLEDRLTWIEQARPLAQRLASLPTPPSTEAGRRNSGPPANTPPTPPAGGEQPKTTYRFQQAGDVSW